MIECNDNKDIYQDFLSIKNNFNIEQETIYIAKSEYEFEQRIYNFANILVKGYKCGWKSVDTERRRPNKIGWNIILNQTVYMKKKFIK